MSSLEHPVPASAPPPSSSAADFLREALIVARFEVVSLIVTVRAILFFLVYGVSATAIGWLFVFLDEKSGGKLTEFSNKVGEVTPEQAKQISEQLGPLGHTFDATVIGAKLPLIVLVVLFVSAWALPALILLVGHATISEDVHTRFSRYVLQRVRRGSWLAGKMLALFAVTWGAAVLVHVILLVWGSVTDKIALGQVAPSMPGFWLALALLVLGYVSFTVLLSSLVTPPFAAFAVASIVTMALWVFSFASIGKFWMGTWDLRLWALDPAAVGVYLAHAAVFTALAYLALRRRDV